PRHLRSHVQALQARYRHSDDGDARNTLRRRIGNLLGASAVLFIGKSSHPASEARKALAKRTLLALQETLRAGVVPVAGTAYLACRSRVKNAIASSSGASERAAYLILLRA